MAKPDVLVRYGADTKGVDSANKKLTKEFDALGKAVTGLFAGASLAGIAAYTKDVIDAITATNRWSKALGVPIKQLSAMGYATETVGISTEQLSDQLKDVSEKIADAYVTGGGEANEALKQLNLSAEDLNKLNPADQLLAIAKGLENVGSRGERIKVMEDLANDATLLLPLLEDNAEGMRRLMAEAESLGVVIDQEMTQKAIAAKEQMRLFDASMDALGMTMAVELMPHITDFVKLLNELTPYASAAGRAIDYLQNKMQDLYFLSSSVEHLMMADLERAAAMWDRIGDYGDDEPPTVLPEIEVTAPPPPGGYKAPPPKPVRTGGGSGGSTAEDEYQKALARLAVEYRSLENAMNPVLAIEREMVAQLDLLNKATALLNVSEEEFERMQKLIVASANEKLDALYDQEEAAEELAFAWDAAGTSVGNALAEMVTGAKTAEGAIRSLLAQVIKLAAQFATQKLLLPALGLSAVAADGMPLPGGSTLSPGVVNSPTLFKFAKGGKLGLAGEAGAEAILPLTRGSSGKLGVEASGMAQNVNVYNYASAEVETRQGINPNDLDIIVRRVTSDVVRGGSPIARGLEATYGLTRGRLRG